MAGEDTTYMYENFTGDEIDAVEVYREQWREINGYAQTCDGAVMCVDCPLNSDDCAAYQEHLMAIGRNDDPVPSFWTMQIAETVGAFSPRDC